VYQKDKSATDSDQERTNSYNKQSFESEIKACRRVIDEAYIYKRLLECEFDYGPTFKRVHELSCNDNDEATANATTFQPDFLSDAVYIQPHIIHSTTLDEIFQLNLVDISKESKDQIPILIPTRVRRMRISKFDLCDNSEDKLKAYTKSAYKGYREPESSIYVINEADDEIRMTIEEFEATYGEL
jgi:hypothetical protein